MISSLNSGHLFISNFNVVILKDNVEKFKVVVLLRIRKKKKHRKVLEGENFAKINIVV